MTPEQIANALGGARKTGDGFVANCPCHDDSTASLSIGYGKNGTTIVVHCFAGCEQRDVIEKLKRRHLWPNGHDKSVGKRKIVAVYDYTDEHGAVLSQNVRYDPKGFSQRRPDPNGGFIWKLGNVRRVLYRLPEVVEAARRGSLILVVEGEKDVDNLRRLGGFTATTSPMGAGKRKWKQEYNESLRGGHVAILQDNDEKGRAHAQAIKVALDGIAASVCLVAPLPGIEDIAKGDASDWIKRGGTSDQLLALIELAAREDAPLKNEAPAPEGEPSNVIDMETARLALLRPVDYERERAKAAKNLGIRAGVLDKEVAKRRPANATLLVNQFDKPLSCMSNCVALLDVAKQRFSFNSMQFIQELDDRPLQDSDVLALNFDLENKAGVPLREGHVRQAISFVCNQRSYHPVLDYVRKIEWDGVDRVDTFMEAYCKTAASAYTKALGKVLLIGAIQRMEHPGENFRYVPIWIGDQLIGKSTALHNLFGDWHFTTNTDFGSERIKHEIQGKWCCEIGDLHAFLRSDLDAMKNFISATSDHFRAPYGHFYIDAKRCLIIVATANRPTCLKDDTGETRFLPILCGVKGQVIDVESILRDRDQLWAEAYYRRGESIWLVGDAAAQAIEHQNAAKEPDVWEDGVATWLEHATPEMLTPENIFLGALKFDAIAKVNPRDQTRLGSVMSRLGYFRPDRRPGKPYRRKDGNDENNENNENNEGGLNQPALLL
jgi:predicted P-loop ATPase